MLVITRIIFFFSVTRGFFVNAEREKNKIKWGNFFVGVSCTGGCGVLMCRGG